ncbi:DUF4868 domain-containing protein [Chitinophagaceae bacterium LB-8]|uniref:DUF4868 domain-containing protein n=1 Tax=Paraflavisolibacter caeni TaxID=2982496 RepID=A0A9X3BHC0_9BACT|nr:Kiwa anti-phage protein KwaB-like domain-containing protein [Paraflavisolibacter caeni]MCU7549322.1 DUF4868 domain-containing protein [Paraflavisolibacter caeni]
MTFSDLHTIVSDVKATNIKLNLIVRNLKEGVKAKDRVLDKYAFTAYQVEIEDELREFFHELTLQQLELLDKEDTSLQPYDPITDDTQKVCTYQMENKALSFSDVVVNQLTGTPPRLKSLDEIFKYGELWAYCVGFAINHESALYTFRKTSQSKIAVEASENPEKNILRRSFNAVFNTNTSKLEPLHGQVINMDKKLDCIFYDSTFYVTQKTNFEHIIGMSEEFKQASTEFIDELEATSQFEGLDVLRKQVDENPTIHRKLSRLAKLKNHKDLKPETILNMQEAVKLEKKELKIKDGKFHLENDSDIDLMIKLLMDYYKLGLVFNKSYGSFSGRVLN